MSNDAGELATLTQQVAVLQRRMADIERVAEVGIWEWDLATGDLMWSDGTYRIYGVDPATPPTVDLFFSLIHPDDRGRIEAAVQQLATDGTPYRLQIRTLRPDGSEWIGEVHGEMIRDAEGRMIRAIGTAQDVTFEARARNALQDSEERNRVLLNSLPDPLVIYDPQGLVIYLNPAFEKTFGWRMEELLGQRIDFVPDDQQAITAEAIRHVLVSNELYSFQTTRYTRDRRVLDIQISASMYSDGMGNNAGLIVILRDVTELLKVQRDFISMQSALISELSTPLMPIGDGIVVMPLIGTIDSRRAQEVTERLLEGVARERANIAIIDITGVPIVDTQIANVLLHAAQAVKLLGAQVVISGISPEIAQTLVGIGARLEGITTLATLQSAIAHGKRRR